MTNIIDTAQIFRYHKQLAAQFGEGSQGALGWVSEAGQRIRFELLMNIGNLDHASVLDAGCGYGDMRPMLLHRYPQARYFGVEQIPSLLKKAVERYGHIPETTFFEGDFSSAELPLTDYILASGSLNYRNSDALFIVKIIEKLFYNCRVGLGFNLNARVEPEGGILVAYDPAFIKALCLQLTNKVMLKQGYYEDDFTLFLYH